MEMKQCYNGNYAKQLSFKLLKQILSAYARYCSRRYTNCFVNVVK